MRVSFATRSWRCACGVRVLLSYASSRGLELRTVVWHPLDHYHLSRKRSYPRSLSSVSQIACRALHLRPFRHPITPMRIPICLAAIIASLLLSACAQQYAGDAISNALPSVPGSEIAYFRIQDSAGKNKNNNLTLINYYSLGKSKQRRPSSIILLPRSL